MDILCRLKPQPPELHHFLGVTSRRSDAKPAAESGVGNRGPPLASPQATASSTCAGSNPEDQEAGNGGYHSKGGASGAADAAARSALSSAILVSGAFAGLVAAICRVAVGFMLPQAAPDKGLSNSAISDSFAGVPPLGYRSSAIVAVVWAASFAYTGALNTPGDPH